MKTLCGRHSLLLGVALASLGGLGCEAMPPPQPTPTGDSTPAEFLEAVALPFTLKNGDVAVTAGYVTVRMGALHNPIRITNVVFRSDIGLLATYLGYSDCAPGCAGSVIADADGTTLATHSIEGTFPLMLPVEFTQGVAPISVVIKLQLDSGIGVQKVKQHCLYVSSASVELADGTLHVITAPHNHYIAAVELTNPPDVSVYKRCK